jgi:DNA polymerase-3 subunit alpha (Gram-positive type)
LSGKNKVIRVETESGEFVGEILKVTSSVREKSLKVRLKSFAEPDDAQLEKINQYFRDILQFTNKIEIESYKITNGDELVQSISLLRETLDTEAISCAKVSCADGVVYFDVTKEVDREIVGFEIERHMWSKDIKYEIRLIQKAPPKQPKERSGGRPSYAKGASKGSIHGRVRGYAKESICDLTERSGSVMVEGFVLGCEIIKTKSGKSYIIKFSLTDYTSSIGATLFVKSSTNIEKLEGIKKGKYIRVEGHAQIDKFSGELNINVDSICEAEAPKETDTALKKRVELHLHTKMSTLDGVVDIKALISRLKDLGHDTVAITDHGVVQGFPEIADAARKAEIKVLYGLEAYLFDDSNPIVRNTRDYALADTFCVFDIETTGLNANADEIIELAAVKVRDGDIKESYHSYVHTDKTITPFIQNLTGITQNKVDSAPPLDKVIGEFIDFAEGTILSAHNASFDMSFIDVATRKLKIDYDPSCVDTLALSRALLKGFKTYKLNTLCKKLHIPLKDHHTALADATATAKLLAHLLDVARNQGINNVMELDRTLGELAMGRDNIYHAIIFAKNQQGLKDMYKLVSRAHLDFMFRGKPHIPKSLLAKSRDNLILGSACEAGELYSAILNNKNKKIVEKIADFYDYLEVQPLGNNEFMLRDNLVSGKNRLIEINKRIIDLGEKLGKPVVATGDVHFLYQRDEYIRRILMHGQKYSDADLQAPLYYRTTREMLDEFDYLDADKAHEIVVDNPRMIADAIEALEPLPPYKLYQPSIEGAEDQVVELTYNRAHEIYGDDLPDVVQKRIDKELNSIVGHGYSVLYLIAHKLVKKSNDDGYLVGSRGSVGSSFVAFLMGITEVNPLPSHYTCNECKHSDFDIDTAAYACGPDMPDGICPVCGAKLIKQGFDIPFEVFLGFEGDKVPDIDLNFSGENQSKVHQYTEVLLGPKNCYRAGTISSIAARTAYGFVKGYLDEHGQYAPRAEVDRLVEGLSGVRRTTGQHPGGIIVVPDDMEVYDFTPIQHPADDQDAGVTTTHFDFNSMHDRLVKLDILGHDDPTMLKMLEKLTGLPPADIPLDDEATMSLFSSTKALGVTPEEIGTDMGTYGIPEFGTQFVREMLKDTMPKTFAELVRISGLSHGTDVWLGNARDLILTGKATLLEAICTRDDIMNALITFGVEPKTAFDTMESVRKGKGLKEYMEDAMAEHDVPEWFVNSCRLIKYMFPKAHAVAYVTMGFRVAYYKVNYPMQYYTAYYTVRADDFDAQVMLGSVDEIKRKIAQYKSVNSAQGEKLGVKEKKILTILEIVLEMKSRGIDFVPIDLYESDATKFKITDKGILPPLNALPGLGETAAKTVVEARKQGCFETVEQLRKRAKLNKSMIQLLKETGCIGDMPESDQVSIFDMM